MAMLQVNALGLPAFCIYESCRQGTLLRGDVYHLGLDRVYNIVYMCVHGIDILTVNVGILVEQWTHV